MIRSFQDRRKEKVFRQDRVKGLSPELQRSALQKLVLLNTTEYLEDLRVPPGNRLEALRGDCQGRFSIRMNDQGRVAYTWRDGDAWDVKLVDYH